MSQILNNWDEYTSSSSYTGTFTITDEQMIIDGKQWIASPYIEIEAGSYRYDIIYSNTAGAQLYIGFEQFDEDKTATSNSSTNYVLSTTNEASNTYLTGTITFNTVGGNPIKYIRLRILNNWNNASTALTGISFLSLRTISTSTPEILKQGILKTDAFKEDNSTVKVFKDNLILSNDFYEI